MARRKKKQKTSEKKYEVLLIEPDSNETEVYSDLIKEVSDCNIDVVSRVGGSVDWITGSQYHLVIMDVSTGGVKLAGSRAIDTLTLLERIKRANPETSVIVMSDKARVEEAVAAIRMGAEDYLKKPFNLDHFKLAIKRGLDRKTIFSGNTGASGFLHLISSCQLISASLDQDRIFEILKSYFSQELGSGYSAVYSQNGDEVVRVARVPKENKPDHAMEEILDISVYASNPFPKMIEGKEVFRFVERGRLTPGLFIFRFTCAEPEQYFFVCLSPTIPASIDLFESKLKMLQTQLEVTGKNINEYMGVKNLIYVDDATGLYNTRYLRHILKKEITRTDASKGTFAVLFMDADKFKQVNDSHGHLIGTKLLHELGHHLKREVRESDVVFRYGGDEFVAVLSPCDLDTAKFVAERIRESIENHVFCEAEGMNIRFTVSIGIALYPEHAKTAKDIVEMADRAMYVAKKKSRNRVYVVDASLTGEDEKLAQKADAAPDTDSGSVDPKRKAS